MALFSWPQWLERQEQRIQRAEIREVRIELRRLVIKRIPREHIAYVAQLALRTGWSNFALRILHPIIRPEINRHIVAQPNELATYAAALSRMGSIAEAESIFEQFSEPTSEILFLEASSHMNSRNYRKARIAYNKYLKKTDISNYYRIVAEMNLATCEVALGEAEKAKDRLTNSFDLIESFPLLHGGCYEVLAQCEFALSNFEMTKMYSKKSQLVHRILQNEYANFSQKWEIIGDCFAKKKLTNDFFNLHLKSVESHFYELTRELDLFSSILRKDENLFNQVLLGTPFESFRQQARKLAPNLPILSSIITNSAAEPFFILDSNHGVIQNQELEKIHLLGKKKQLLQVLTKDFYRPQLLGAIFSDLYPEESFNLNSSPHRVRKIISIFNQYLNAKKIDIRVNIQNGSFYLSKENTSWALNLKLEIQQPRISSAFLSWLENLEVPFVKRQDIENKFQISKSTANRWIQKSLEKGLLKPGPYGSKTRFQRNKLKAA